MGSWGVTMRQSDYGLDLLAYQNACRNSDRETAVLEGNEAVKRAALTMTEDTTFLRLYYDNTAFHNRLHREIVEETYPTLSRFWQNAEHGGERDTEPYNYKFEYRRLSVLKSDCEYFLGAGQRHEKHLSEGSMEAQIAKMRELYDAIPEKPEWLTAEDIDRYEAQMKAGAVTVAVPNYEATVTAEEAASKESNTEIPSDIEIRTMSFGPERHNFHITDDNLGVGGEKTKYQYNVAAMDILDGYYNKMFPFSGETVRYEKAKKQIESKVQDSHMKEQMLYLLEKTSDSAGLSAAVRKLKDHYKDIDDRRVKKILSAFDKLGIAPITRPNN